ncbi:MAG: sugar ABC transporter permease [Armatimonadetes bacterium]|nr:sugar ABC transporter permease [Armatimonadota bacterium]
MTNKSPSLRQGRGQGMGSWLFAAPHLILFVAFVLGPLLFGLGLSLFRWDILTARPAQFVGPANYQEALKDEYVYKALWATVRFVYLAVPATILLGLLLAVGLSQVNEKRRAFWRALCYLPHLLTVSVVGLLWRWFYNTEFGLFNAYLNKFFGIKIAWLSDVNWAMPAIVIMTLWWTLGGPMLVFLAAIQNIPNSYHEAAAIDGATGTQAFFKITLPLLRPVLLFSMVMNVIGSFQVFGQVFMITRGGPELSTRTLVQYIYDTAFNNYRMGYAAAISWLLFLVIAVFSIIQFRLMRESK